MSGEQVLNSPLRQRAHQIAANIPARWSDKAVRDDVTSDPQVAETEQIEQAKRGDREAFGALYRRHYASVHRLASFYLNGTAEDAASETFLRAWKALPRYRDTGAPFSAWLYGIARHVVSDALRAQRRVEPRADVPDAGEEDKHETNLLVAQLVARLPKDQRRVIEMKYLLGMTNPEVSAQLGKSIGAVNALQWRALKAMRELMEETS